MKNKFFKYSLIVILFLNITSLVHSEELNIKSGKININKEKSNIIFKEKVIVKDIKNNILETDFANYKKKDEVLKTVGSTNITTSQNYKVVGSNITFDNLKGVINSSYPTTIKDTDGNIINVDMFNYDRNKNIFFSKGNIIINDINGNIYKFSEIYINEKQKKIVGTDVKVFLKQEDLKSNPKNEPRIFANTVLLDNKDSEMGKGVFTYCKNRGKDKCPPWSLQADKIRHSQADKTIYYDNAVLKVYDFPIFYFPKFFHPDPTVDRRSGFLVPSFVDNSNLGEGIVAPYFWDISKESDLTLTPRVYFNENPLLLAEYRQDFKNSFLILDSGYSKGYKNKSSVKESGTRKHFFADYKVDLFNNSNSSNLNLKVQHVSNDTYFKAYDVDTLLVEKEQTVIDNSISFYQQSEDSFLGITASSFENLGDYSPTRFEYIANATYDKNLFTNNKLGIVDLTSNLSIKNYEVNKQTEFFVNDFNWSSNKWINDLGVDSQFKGLFKTVNYNAEKTKVYKNDQFNSEFYGGIGYLAKLPLFKNNFISNTYHNLTPKFLLRYAPGDSRNINNATRLNYTNIFSIDRLNELDVIETGLSTTIGLQYDQNEIDEKGNVGEEKLSFSIGQIINESENLDMPAPLNQRFSDIVGDSYLKVNENLSLRYSYALDQNYNDLNYSEIGSEFIMGAATFNLKYLEEKEHIGNQEYLQAGLDMNIGESNKISFSGKRNLLIDSSEFYNLSYEYLNDCLKAGIFFRREFYNDRDIEPDNSLMFKITIMPFSNFSSPKFR